MFRVKGVGWENVNGDEIEAWVILSVIGLEIEGVDFWFNIEALVLQRR